MIDYQIRLWKDYQQIKSVKLHTGSIRNLALHPSGQQFLSCGNDGAVMEYTLEGEMLNKYQNPPGLEGQAAYTFSVVVHPKTNQVVTANDDMCVRVHSITDGNLTTQALLHPSTVWDVKVLPNGDIVSAATDGVIRIFTTNEARMAVEPVREAYSKKVQEVIAALEARQSNQ